MEQFVSCSYRSNHLGYGNPTPYHTPYTYKRSTTRRRLRRDAPRAGRGCHFHRRLDWSAGSQSVPVVLRSASTMYVYSRVLVSSVFHFTD